MENKETLLITGGEGLVGTALAKWAKLTTSYEVVSVGRKDFDLTKEDSVRALFYTHKPDVVIHAAARVGGIGLNLSQPAKQYYDNIMMNTLMIDQAYINNVRKFIAFGSMCAFPANLQLMVEEKYHSGPPFEAHKAYAYSKRMVEIQLDAYFDQFRFNGKTVIPGNIFGPNDNFDLENGHVIPALIRKCWEAKRDNKPFEVWGDGSATREFIYSEDLARAVLSLLEYDNGPGSVIISGRSHPIWRVVEIICDAFGYPYDRVVYNSSSPVGQVKRKSSMKVFNSLFPQFKFSSFEDSLTETCNWYREAEASGKVRLQIK